MPLMSALGKQKQADLCEFEISRQKSKKKKKSFLNLRIPKLSPQNSKDIFH